jgi:Uma2 family endonuclease
MGMAHPTGGWTAETVRALPEDGNRYEVVGGELLVTPSPAWRHQLAIGGLYRALDQYVREQVLGAVIFAPAAIEFDERNLVEPDLFVVPLVEGAKPREWADVGRLLLAVEVLSPNTARHDRFTKRRLYQARGVPEYWIIDLDARLIERWKPDQERPDIIADKLAWQPDPSRPPLELDLPAYFADVLGIAD